MDRACDCVSHYLTAVGQSGSPEVGGSVTHCKLHNRAVPILIMVCALSLDTQSRFSSKLEGIAQALLFAEQFLGGESVALMLGDNVLFGHGLEPLLVRAIERNTGATIFVYRVQDPERYGVLGFDGQGKPNSIEEKPKNAKSKWAITGLYLYGSDAVRIAKRVKPSARGELRFPKLTRTTYRKDGLRLNLWGVDLRGSIPAPPIACSKPPTTWLLSRKGRA